LYVASFLSLSLEPNSPVFSQDFLWSAFFSFSSSRCWFVAHLPFSRRDQYLTSTLDCSYILPFDSIIISTGSHQACYRCPPTSTFISHISQVFTDWPQKIQQCRQQALTGALLRAEDGTASTADLDLARRLEKPVKFVYVTSPAWYPQAKETKDCRSAQRIGRWNELAADKALKSGWSVVDAGELSRPMQQDTRLMDGVHCTLLRLYLSVHVDEVKRRGDETDNISLFFPLLFFASHAPVLTSPRADIRTDAIDPMVDELVQKLEICGNESESRV
jgi:hypothetical protein